ncbi:hypothetical protein MK805_02275 [Shimazuella sp. AN120528]|uniref:hypothetical protein n=1 Tax=Shimazuella soli TaxID=1892854 RepID=UPI001F0E749B|nr:hypothetical protein [Shimazuella soli]MCH5583794.1 hypothetical protein [Shimazuella soli]
MIKHQRPDEEIVGEMCLKDMIYYNHYYYQWDLKKMAPVHYRDHLLKVHRFLLKCP